MAGKYLSLGIQNFEDFIKHDYIYVDKTKLIYDLVSLPKAFYFFSRPRRFGKSLLVSTLGYLFEGRKDLFKGLWISKNQTWEWEKFPVIKIDFNQINHTNGDQLKQSIMIVLNQIAKQHALTINIEYIPNFFTTLLCELEKKYQKPIVVLIDEYDKPIISHLGKGEDELNIARENREVLKQLFGVLKGQNVTRALRFVFLTGVSKFSQVSIFSDLNNLNDITLQENYASLLGYTQNEIEHYFKKFIKNLMDELKLDHKACLKKLRSWYNGYKFSENGERVYNPFSILNVLHTKTFKNYWFETGTPSFLVNLIKENNYSIPQIEQLELRESVFTSYDIDTLSLEALLFQTGYITLGNKHGRLFRLNYPNQEVKNSFIDYLYEKLIPVPDSVIKNRFTLLVDYLVNNKIDNFIETVNAILSSIPYTQIANQDESYYHTVFYLILTASGVEVLTEVITSRGRIDIAVFFEDTIFIIELKCNQSANEAIKQIKTKRYADKYKNEGKQIRLMGINFDTEKREITDWKVE